MIKQGVIGQGSQIVISAFSAKMFPLVFIEKPLTFLPLKMIYCFELQRFSKKSLIYFRVQKKLPL